MKVIDSKKKLLDGPEIVTRVAYEMDLGGMDPKIALIALAKEMTMESADPKQFGNTVFLGHYTKDKTGVYMRSFNMDTAKNFVDNGEKYIKYLMDRGVDKMYTEFFGRELLHVFKLFSKRPGTKDMTFNYFNVGKNKHGVEVLFTPSKD